MNDILNTKLTKILLDLIIFFEFSNEDGINEDSVIEILESVGAEMLEFDMSSKQQLLKIISKLSKYYDGEEKVFIENFAQNFGLLD